LISKFFFVDYNGGRRLLWDKRAGRYTVGALLLWRIGACPTESVRPQWKSTIAFNRAIK